MSTATRRLARIAIWIAGLGALAALGLAATRSLSGPDAPASGPESVRVTRRDVGRVIRATGVIKPAIGAEVRVGSRVSGVVTRLHVRVGDVVRAGDLLAELDARELAARRDDAVAALRVADANLAYARSELARKERLRDERLLPPSELDLATRGAEVAAQERAQAAATLTFAATQLSYARIVAPISGVVASVTTQEGETVAASFAAPTFLTLIDLGRLEVRAYVDETDIGRITRGQPASFTVDTYGDEAFAGTVGAIYPQAEVRDNVVNYVAVIRFARPAGRTLRPEMTTAVRLPLDVRRQAVALPLKAIRTDGTSTFVLRRRGGAVERRAVRLGVRDDTYGEVLEGVNEGDEVLVGEAAPDTAPTRGE
jgi:RND family efflux transporter MFP subunit